MFILYTKGIRYHHIWLYYVRTHADGVMTSSLIRPSTSSADRQTDRRCHLLVSLLKIMKRIKTDIFFYFFFTIIITYNNTRAGLRTIAVAVVPHTYLRRQQRTTATIRCKYYNMFLVMLQTIVTKWQSVVRTKWYFNYHCSAL